MKLIQTRKWLAQHYDVHPTTIKKWLRGCGIMHRRGLTPADIDLFIRTVGSPKSIDNLFDTVVRTDRNNATQ